MRRTRSWCSRSASTWRRTRGPQEGRRRDLRAKSAAATCQALTAIWERLGVPESVVYEYVTSTLVVEHEELVATHHERETARHPFPLS